MIGTYMIKHPSGIFYIGQTVNYITRQRNHISQLNRNTHHATLLQDAYNLNPNIEWEFFNTTDGIEAIALEDYYIRVNIGNPNMANKVGNEYSFSDEHRKNISLAGLGRTQSDEHRAKTSDHFKTVERTADWCSAISDSMKNSDAMKANMQRIHIAARRKVTDGVNVYASLKDAATAHGIHSASAIERIRSTSIRFIDWAYVE